MTKFFSTENDRREVLFGISEKKHGDMRVARDSDLELTRKAREDFFNQKRFEGFEIAAALLEHGSVISEANGPGFYPGDGLVTMSKHLLLTVTVADCLPVFFYDSELKNIGLLHAGFRGLADEAVFKMAGFFGPGAKVFIGPHICKDHYNTDLRSQAVSQFLKQGIKQENIEYDERCTFENEDSFFSYRRDRPIKPIAMVAFIGMNE